MPGVLYLVATPIGNLSDITLRALETLKNVDLILAEDTRVTPKLLKHYDIDTPTLSYHHHSSESKKLQILKRLLDSQNLALVTDAGTPGLSDPGNELVNFIYNNLSNATGLPFAEILADPTKRGPSKDFEKGSQELVRVIPIPGPSSLTAAISVSGFNLSKFIFLGYFPKKKKSKIIKLLKNTNLPAIYFDSPHRLVKNLELIKEQVGNREILIARELTKLYETLYRGTISQVIKKLHNNLKGELVVIINKRTLDK
jgi:16S rRNA (cytidine1402-2'-O)-methyltransferase